MRSALRLLVAFVLTVSFAQGAEAATPLAATLRVNIVGVTKAGGTLRVELFDEATFADPAALPLRHQDIANIAGDVAVIFQNLPPGAYALKAFEDVNNNGVADAGEPAGFSNNAAGHDFVDAAILLVPGANAATVHLH